MAALQSENAAANFASYVPRLIVHRLAADPTPIKSASSEHYPAAVLFTDISGFTALAEHLTQHSQAGAEEISAILNNLLSA